MPCSGRHREQPPDHRHRDTRVRGVLHRSSSPRLARSQHRAAMVVVITDHRLRGIVVVMALLGTACTWAPPTTGGVASTVRIPWPIKANHCSAAHSRGLAVIR